jgi:hypothetical protein
MLECYFCKEPIYCGEKYYSVEGYNLKDHPQDELGFLCEDCCVEHFNDGEFGDDFGDDKKFYSIRSLNEIVNKVSDLNDDLFEMNDLIS